MPEETLETQSVGRGRGGPNRPKRPRTQKRYIITAVLRNEAAIAPTKWRMGWRLYATNTPPARLSLEQAIPMYRHAPRIERNFHLLLDAPIGIHPIDVRRDEIIGLCRLISA